MSDLDRLRHLLLNEEHEKLARAEQRIAELEKTNDELAALLPGLVTAAPQEPMSRALAMPVAAALGNAVHRNRASIVDALFPVIGPIIRKAIAEALRGLMRDLNQVLEHGFSPRGIRWRIEAWRSGVPFAQIVLKHSLRYQVDHVFLIERDSGLVLHRESSPGLPDLDADAIAGMLTAIGQFVRDSVGRDGGDSLEAARVGEHLLWVLDGPRASLACFIEGVPPDSLRTVLGDRLELIHARMSEPAGSQTGDSTTSESDLGASLDPVDLVAASAALDEGDGQRRQQTSRWPMLIILLLVVVGLGWRYLHNERWHERVEGLRAELIAHPGFLLTGIESKPWSRLTVHGLIDADAEPVQPILERVDLGETQATLETDGYLSTDDAILLIRAKRLLQAPANVHLDVHDGVLAVSGQADREWIAGRQQQAAWIAGVRKVDWKAAETADDVAVARAALDKLANDLAAETVVFAKDIEPGGDTEAQLKRMAEWLNQAQVLATRADVDLRLRIDGYNDASGSDSLNAKLRLARASWLRDRLRDAGASPELLHSAALNTETDAKAGIRGARVQLQTARKSQ